MANGITAQQAIEATQGSGGYVSVIAKRLGCSQRYVYNLRDKYATFAEALQEERTKQLDFAEGKLQEQIKASNMTAIIFYLKTQGKDRGYVERVQNEVTNPDGKPLTVKVVYEHKERDLDPMTGGEA